MKTKNISVDQFVNYIEDKDIYIFGIGDFYQRLSRKVIYPDIHKKVAGYIDNGRKGETITVFGQEYNVYGVEFLKSVQRGVILLCGTTYLDEMYRQLVAQCLPDELECFIMPLVWAVSDGRDNPDIMRRLLLKEDSLPEAEYKIEKKIHCFWFSGERKPEISSKNFFIRNAVSPS